MGIRRLDPSGQCCTNQWKEKLEYLYRNYNSVVKSASLNGEWMHPDGQGNLNLGYITENDFNLIDKGSHFSLTIYENNTVVSLTNRLSYWDLTIGD